MLKRKIISVFGLLLVCTTALAADPFSSRVRNSTTNFNNNLSSADSDVQKALDTLDNLSIGDITAVGDVTSGAAFTGTQGTTLTFDNAGGDMTQIYNGSKMLFSKPLTVTGDGSSFSGTLGVGVVPSTDTFEVQAATTPFVATRWTDTTSYGGLRFYENSSLVGGFLVIGTNFSVGARRNFFEMQNLKTGGGLSFWTSTNGQSVTILDSGYMGVGSTTPGARLDVDNLTAAVSIARFIDNGTVKISVIDGGDLQFASGVNLDDANSNELLKFTQTASAVNEITIGNNSTGANATITASGETNTGITITGKGTKGVAFGNATLPKVVAISDGAGAVIDASLGNIFTWTATADRTAGTTTNPVAGQKIVIEFTASGGARTLTLPTATTGDFRFNADITTLTATTSGKTDYIGCIYNGAASRWDVVAVTKGA